MTAEEEWPEGFDMVSELVRHMGTDWVQRCCDELTAAAREDAYEYQSITDGDSEAMSDSVGEEIGLLADTADNLLAAMTLPLPPAMHLQALKSGLEEMRTRLRQACIALTGENPWEE